VVFELQDAVFLEGIMMEEIEYIHYTFKCGWETTLRINEVNEHIHDRCPYCHPEQYNYLKLFTIKDE